MGANGYHVNFKKTSQFAVNINGLKLRKKITDDQIGVRH